MDSTDLGLIPNHCFFLRLPAEIREQVYRILLRSANNRHCPPVEEGYEYDPKDPLSGPYYSFDLSLLRVNRLISKEANKVFQDNIFVKITTPFPGAISHVNSEGKVAVVSTEDHAKDFQDFHLRVLISTPDLAPWRMQNHDENYSMITCLEDLDPFTTIWYFSNLNSGRQLNAYLTLRLDLKNPYHAGTTVPKPLQEKLLLPFGRVKDLHTMAFDFHGAPFFADCAVYPSIKNAVQNEQAVPVPTPEECIDACIAHKGQGLALVGKKEYTAAMKEYFTALEQIHVFCQGRKRDVHCDAYYSAEFQSGPFKDQYAHYVRLLLRIQLVGAVMQVFLLMHDYEEAYFWGQRSIRLLRESHQNIETIGGEGWDEFVREMAKTDFAGKSDFAWIFWRTAVAKREIGRLEVEQCDRQRAAWARGEAKERPETPDKSGAKQAEVEALEFAARTYADGDELLSAEFAALKIREFVRGGVRSEDVS